MYLVVLTSYILAPQRLLVYRLIPIIFWSQRLLRARLQHGEPIGLLVETSLASASPSPTTFVTHPEVAAPASNTEHSKRKGAFYLNYALLVVNSFGLQNAWERSQVDIGHFFTRCHAAATACATIIRDEIGPAGELRYCTDSNFVQCSYAVLSLLKVIPPIVIETSSH